MFTFLFMYRKEDRRTIRSITMATKATPNVKNTRAFFIFVFEVKICQLVSPVYFISLNVDEKVMGGHKAPKNNIDKGLKLLS